MELWIRSQDKNVLQKTNALFIANTDKNIFSIIDNVNMTKYGTYSTQKRALEVLDEIQRLLIAMPRTAIPIENILYEMPEY